MYSLRVKNAWAHVIPLALQKKYLTSLQNEQEGAYEPLCITKKKFAAVKRGSMCLTLYLLGVHRLQC